MRITTTIRHPTTDTAHRCARSATAPEVLSAGHVLVHIDASYKTTSILAGQRWTIGCVLENSGDYSGDWEIRISGFGDWGIRLLGKG